MIASVVEHAVMGGFFACAGAGARCLCPGCMRRQIFLAALFILVEAVVMVTVIDG